MVKTIILPNVPAKKPSKLPIADFRAIELSFPAYFSPKNAPIKGPNKSKKKPSPEDIKVKTNPTTNPIELPLTPYFEPPNFFVPNIGTI